MMSAITLLNLQCAQGAYPDLTFSPVASSNPGAAWQSSDLNETLDGRPTLTQLVDRKNGGLNKMRTKLRVPFMETVVGQSSSGYQAAPKVAYFVGASLDLMFPSRSTADQRLYLVNALADYLTSQDFRDMVTDMATPY